jgi:hypothetical protein
MTARFLSGFQRTNLTLAASANSRPSLLESLCGQVSRAGIRVVSLASFWQFDTGNTGNGIDRRLPRTAEWHRRFTHAGASAPLAAETDRHVLLRKVLS